MLSVVKCFLCSFAGFGGFAVTIMVLEGILKYIDSNKQELVEFTKELVSVPTVNPPGDNYENVVSLIENKCKEINLETKRFLVPKKELRILGVVGGSPRINLLAQWHTSSEKTLHINGHYDVVPATSNWHTPAFKPTIKNGRLYGRGTEDMKGDIACMLFAVEAIKKSGLIPCVNVQMSFTPDEETGGGSGLGYLVRRGLIKADFALGEGYGGDFVSIGNKGILWMEIEVLGKSSHASRPYKGINAFDKMVSLSYQFNRLKKKVEARHTRYYTKYSIDSFATFVMGGLSHGGNKTNTVPDKTVFSIDRRILPEETLCAARREILKVIRQAKLKDKNLRLKLKVTAQEEPAISTQGSLISKAASVAIKEVTGKKAHFAIMPGGTDLRYFIWRGIPSIGYSVLGGERWHGDDEFVYIDSLINTAKIYAVTIMEL